MYWQWSYVHIRGHGWIVSIRHTYIRGARTRSIIHTYEHTYTYTYSGNMRLIVSMSLGPGLAWLCPTCPSVKPSLFFLSLSLFFFLLSSISEREREQCRVCAERSSYGYGDDGFFSNTFFFIIVFFFPLLRFKHHRAEDFPLFSSFFCFFFFFFFTLTCIYTTIICRWLITNPTLL